MEDIIKENLLRIEKENNIKILFACESGSRAWGFPSKDSDWDVRFIYVHPIEWYLTLDPGRDVIEYPINDRLDISGWDLKKALQLLKKTNPPLLEWLGSPIVYSEWKPFHRAIYGLVDQFYSTSNLLYHYLHMANGNFREYLQGDTVWVKKYFYVLRPLLAMKWLVQDRGRVPTDFNIMLDKLTLDSDFHTHLELKNEIVNLLERKRTGEELDKGPRILVISNFIEKELKMWNNVHIAKAEVDPNNKLLDSFFYEVIKEAWK